jgi:hypothetical protein
VLRVNVCPGEWPTCYVYVFPRLQNLVSEKRTTELVNAAEIAHVGEKMSEFCHDEKYDF